eukprot:Hpha_TRINITY_DN16136_c5_g1::TRINITY_DN16136_c5_g1_i1::g.3387::m.3387
MPPPTEDPDENLSLAIILSIAAGLATMVGGMAVFFPQLQLHRRISGPKMLCAGVALGVILYASFVGISMIFVSFVAKDTIAIAMEKNGCDPKVETIDGELELGFASNVYTTLSFLGGMLIVSLLEKFVNSIFPVNMFSDEEVGYMHAIMHNTHVYHGTGSKWRALWWWFLPSGPLCVILGVAVLRTIFTVMTFYVSAIAGGVMVCIVCVMVLNVPWAEGLGDLCARAVVCYAGWNSFKALGEDVGQRSHPMRDLLTFWLIYAAFNFFDYFRVRVVVVPIHHSMRKNARARESVGDLRMYTITGEPYHEESTRKGSCSHFRKCMSSYGKYLYAVLTG